MPIDYEKRNSVAYITLNNPEKANILDKPTSDDISAAWIDLWESTRTGAYHTQQPETCMSSGINGGSDTKDEDGAPHALLQCPGGATMKLLTGSGNHSTTC